MSKSESMDLHALMQQHMKTPPAELNNHLDNHNHQGGACRESDSESGFEDYSSQMSKSINDEFALHASLMSHSTSIDNLMVDQLVTELKSVAVDWKPLRSVKQCYCALPFEHHIRRVSVMNGWKRRGGRKERETGRPLDRNKNMIGMKDVDRSLDYCICVVYYSNNICSGELEQIILQK